MLEKIVRQIIAGQDISRKEAEFLIDVDLQQLKQAANQIREYFCGNDFDLCSIINGKSGRCSEDCKYCGQSIHYQTKIKVYDLLEKEIIEDIAVYNANQGVGRFSIVTSGRYLSDEEFSKIIEIYQYLNNRVKISLCASLGLLNLEQFNELKAVGVKRYHNNLETSRNYFTKICTTHSYDQKIKTIKAAKQAGLEICSGGIMGMGESWNDRLDLAFELKSLKVNSIPINILNPILGTPLQDHKPLAKEEIERIIAVFRFIHPSAVIRMAGGRGLLNDKGMGVYKSGGNGAITGDMLTTQGITIAEDKKMIKMLGFKVNKI
ncbi:biotin synthase BioB [Thomasclavelia cocleata]|uniref:Biotin synthase n=1 Tax=Thomasclavelia cocleata TaxID=69824 RepID=A0A1I0DLJ1_9FIRM|nr:biotin synthase BioB [Thomasclavelia cocleata]MCR1961272.1 biotin synthase BioB [Thomasclavelia cocleata]NDO42699.1 biotin synthase BioB [Thomasclavelia cocleata]PJN80478.1 biotin synthase BioB [Thomasclavelia cocleata]SET32973.1 biotin synthase [Thomasclavelia cocleata]